MSNVLVGIIGVILFIGLSVAGAAYYGPVVLGSKIEAQATDYLSQSSQISRAIEAYSSDNGKPPPITSGVTNDSILVTGGYLRSAPPGGREPWIWYPTLKALLTPIGADNVEGTKVCIAARKRAGIPNPGQIKACDGSGGALAKADPCCLK